MGAPEESHEEEAGGGHCQPSDVEAIGVEGCDDDDGADVVHDGKAQEQHLQFAGNAVAEQGEHAESEGDVGGHRDAPSRDAVAAEVERDIEESGHHHAAERTGSRHGCIAERGEPAVDELVLDLQADDEEEQRHHAVVDPVAQILGDDVPGEIDGERGAPQIVVRRGPGRVRPDECNQGCACQEDPTGRLDVEKPGDRLCH